MNSPEWIPSLLTGDAVVPPIPLEPAGRAPLDGPPHPVPVLTTGEGSRAVEWFTPGRFALALALLVVAAFPEITLGLKTFVHRDFGLFGYPLAHYYRECFWRGELPLWNPYNNGGLPFLAQWNTMILYPGSLIYLLFPLPWSLNFFCLFHLFWAGLGMYGLVQRWTGHRLAAAMAGVAFAFNGLTLNALMWPNNIAALGWMPWVVWWAEEGWRRGGRSLLAAAALAALQLLTGAPEIVLFTGLLVAGVCIGHWWKHTRPQTVLLGRGMAMGALAAGLSAAQMLPFLDLMAHSHRDASFATNAWPMPAWGWANFLVPLFRMNRSGSGLMYQPDQFWTSSHYVSIAVVGLALWAMRQWRQPRIFLLTLALLGSLILALGDAGYLYRWLHEGFPMANVMRFPIKFVVVAIFVFPILAGMAVQAGARAANRDAQKWRRSARGVWLALIFGIAGVLAWAWLWPMHPTDWMVSCKSGVLRLVFLSLVFLALPYALRPDPPRGHWWLAPFIVVLIWLDVLTHAPWQNPAAANAVLKAGQFQSMKTKPTLGESRAMLTLAAMDEFYRKNVPDAAENLTLRRRGLHNDLNLLEGIPKVDGFFSLYLPEERAVHFRLYASEREVRAGLADFLGVTQVTARSNTLDWESRATAMPLVTGGQGVVFAENGPTLTNLIAREFNPRQVVFLPPEARAVISATNEARVRVKGSTWSPHHLTVEVEADHSSVVVLSQCHYHSWQALVDGLPARVWRANLAFQAVAIPAGRHRVELVYQDRGFKTGLIVTGLTLGTWLMLWWRGRRRVE